MFRAFRASLLRNYTEKFANVNFSNSKCSSNFVGFIGLGNMGVKMAKNLLQKGENLVIYDIRPINIEQFETKPKPIVVDNLKEVARKSKYIITMLPSSDSVMSTYTDDDGILKNCPHENAIFIDSSTIDPNISKEIWKLANKRGHLFLDAPVSGGVVGAEAGNLTFMIGGCERIPEYIEKLLLKMGSRIIHCGSSGMGQAAKLCNNMLLGSTMVAVSETLNLGMKFGLDAKVLTSIINSSSGRCWSSEIYNPVPGVLENVPSNRNYKGGFTTNLLLKDMKLALKLAEKTNSSVLLAEKALEIYNNAIVTKGIENSDFSIIYKTISEKK